MNEVIKQINDLYNTLQAKVASFDNASASLAKKQANLEAQAKEILSFSESIKARELEVKKIENVVKLEESAKQAFVEAKEIKKQAEKLVADKDAEIRNIRNLIANERIEADKIILEAKHAGQDLDRRKAALELRESTYKEEIMKKLKAVV